MWLNTLLKIMFNNRAENYFDQAIRDDDHFRLTYEYINNNANNSGLKDYESRFYGIYK